jgi:hypothetical protein
VPKKLTQNSRLEGNDTFWMLKMVSKIFFDSEQKLICRREIALFGFECELN